MAHGRSLQQWHKDKRPDWAYEVLGKEPSQPFWQSLGTLTAPMPPPAQQVGSVCACLLGGAFHARPGALHNRLHFSHVMASMPSSQAREQNYAAAQAAAPIAPPQSAGGLPAQGGAGAELVKALKAQTRLAQAQAHHMHQAQALQQRVAEQQQQVQLLQSIALQRQKQAVRAAARAAQQQQQQQIYQAQAGGGPHQQAWAAPPSRHAGVDARCMAAAIPYAIDGTAWQA